MRNCAFLFLGLLISSRSAFSQTTVAEWEERLVGRRTLVGTINKEQGHQWQQVDQRETMGQKCGSGMIFNFMRVPPRRQMQQKVCKDSAWVASTYTWRVRVMAGADPELLLDDKPAYYLRIVTRDGTQQLRFTKPGGSPAEPTVHYYFSLR